MRRQWKNTRSEESHAALTEHPILTQAKSRPWPIPRPVLWFLLHLTFTNYFGFILWPINLVISCVSSLHRVILRSLTLLYQAFYRVVRQSWTLLLIHLSHHLLSSLKPFKHRRLDHGPGWLRLCRFRRSHYGATIECNLEHWHLDFVSLPQYIALSYEWGVSDSVAKIIVNGKCYTIKKNLFEYLDQAHCTHNSEWGAWLWIDQISIDQSNITERNHQVQQMSRIYARAALVVAWLGASDYCSDVVATFLRRKDEFPRLTDRLAFMHFEEYHAVLSLFHRRYFSRLWIVQELLLARDLMLACGTSQALSWKDLLFLKRRADEVASDFPHFIEDTLEPHLAILLRPLQRTDGRDLEDVLIFAINECDDLRDKVYGLQGLVKENQRLIIDYTKTEVEVFVDVVFALLHSSRQVARSEHLKKLAAAMGRSSLWNGTVSKYVALYSHDIRSSTGRRRKQFSRDLVRLCDQSITLDFVSKAHTAKRCDVCYLRFGNDNAYEAHVSNLHGSNIGTMKAKTTQKS